MSRIMRSFMNKMGVTMNQASGLRNMQRNHRIKVVTVTGGKGGVGKSNVTLNVGMSLAAQGKRVLIEARTVRYTAQLHAQ